MTQRVGVAVVAALTLAVSYFALTHVTFTPQNPHAAQQANATSQDRFGGLPINFEINRGQTDERVRFLARGSGYTLFLTDMEAALLLQRGEDSNVLRVRPYGAQTPSSVDGVGERPAKSNYFIGADAAHWKRDIPNYEKVRYSSIYPGIDVVYYGNKEHQLEYDFVVAPNADPRQVKLEFEGADRLRLDDSGDLVIEIGGAEVRQEKPVIYQENEAGGRDLVAGNYTIDHDNLIGFEIAEYDATRPLVVDPILIFSTYFGGQSADWGMAIAIDAQKNVYFTGGTSSTNYPVVNPYQPQNRSYNDIVVTKLNSTGTQVLFSTYVGATSGGSTGDGIDVDAAGNVYVTGGVVGFSSTHDFPVTANAFDPTFNGTDDIVFFKLAPTGNALTYSTFVGSDNSDRGREIKVDRITGDVYIGGIAYQGGTGQQQVAFPVTPNAFRQTCGAGVACGYVLKFSGQNNSQLVYSTFITGGSVNDIAIDQTGSVYLTGQSIGDLQTTAGAPQPTCNGCGLNRFDAYIAKLNPQGSALTYATYIGGSLTDRGNSIAIDSALNAYITGKAEGGIVPFPTTPGAFRTDGVGPFVTKLNPTGTAFVYSTLLGGTLNSEGFGIAVDPQGRAHVTGEGITQPWVKPFQGTGYASARHPFIATLNENGSALLFSTLFGAPGSGNEILSDEVGDIYVVGQTYGELPLANPVQPQIGLYWQYDVFISKISFGANRQVDNDFEGDAKANLAVFRPQDQTWYLHDPFNGSNPMHQIRFGLATDKLVPADYEGDGRDDVAVFRDGVWHILLRSVSPDAQYRSVQFGVAGDIPVPADYDNDGVSDIAVFRPSTGVWYIWRSSDGGYDIFQFGLSEDKPQPGDYDGDGRADIAVFRPSKGVWWIRPTSDSANFRAIQFGISSDVPVPADYDGDGKTDVAVYRNGTWYVLHSLTGDLTVAQFGLASDHPVPDDYDRDGRADFAVFRNGDWYILQSRDGLSIRQFGIAGDIPTASAIR